MNDSEQQLINRFVCAMRCEENDEGRRIQCVHNQKCRARKFADVEFTSTSGQRWAIEAKYGADKNKANEVHKLFGDLLRETGCDRSCRQKCKIGLLLHSERENYFRNGVKRIPRNKFVEFGRLVPISAVFVLEQESVRAMTWEQFYDGDGT